MPDAPRDEDDVAGETEPKLGCERGGLQSAEALLLARYFMFSQVYFHPTRLAYNEHLKDFLVEWLPTGRFSPDPAGHLSLDDNDVLAAMRRAARDPRAPGHLHAVRILRREHFKVAYRRREQDSSEDVRALADAAAEKFDPSLVRYGASPSRGEPPDFPVGSGRGTSESATGLSDVFDKLPTSPDEYVLVDRAILGEVARWLSAERDDIVDRAREVRTELAEKEADR